MLHGAVQCFGRPGTCAQLQAFQACQRHRHAALPAPAPAAGNAAVAQCMCAVVVDLAGLVASVPAAAAAPAELLLPFPAALRHNDCHYIYQVGSCCALPAALRHADL